MGKLLDITGQKFGRLTVVDRTDKKYRGSIIWHVKCDCGNEFDIHSRQLISGNTKSCGCFKRSELSRRMTKDALLVKGNGVWKNYRRNALKRGFVMELTKEEVLELASEPCKYCGIEPNDYHGIDRVDSSIGYTHNNTVACCWMCNRAKGDSSVEEFLEWSKRLYERQIS